MGKAWKPKKINALSEGEHCTEKYIHLVLKGLNSIYPVPVVFSKKLLVVSKDALIMGCCDHGDYALCMDFDCNSSFQNVCSVFSGIFHWFWKAISTTNENLWQYSLTDIIHCQMKKTAWNNVYWKPQCIVIIIKKLTHTCNNEILGFISTEMAWGQIFCVPKTSLWRGSKWGTLETCPTPVE